MTAAEFRALYDELRTWDRWEEHPERGALNLLTPERVAAAARLVRSGASVTLGRPLDTQQRIDNPVPADHHMTMLPRDEGAGGLCFTKDYVGADYHNEGHSHLDAFCHVAFDDRLYGGAPEDAVTAAGARVGSIALLEDGLVGRGVMLDIPRLHDVPWLEPGTAVTVADLEAAERTQGVTVGAGDILLVRTGHARRLSVLGPWDTAAAKAGLHPEAARFLADRGVVALGSDGNNDAAPTCVDGVGFPIHVLALNAMGVHLLDYLQFEDVVPRCEQAGRWAFLFVAAPLRVAHGTGSPANPIAVL